MDIVNHLGYEIPYFIDGRTGTRDFYKKNPERPDKFFSCNYKTDRKLLPQEQYPTVQVIVFNNNINVYGRQTSATPKC